MNNTAIVLITHDLPAFEEPEEFPWKTLFMLPSLVQALWIDVPVIALFHYFTFIPGVLL